MDQKTPKIRFGIAPGRSARLSEDEHKAAAPASSVRIEGGRSSRIAEAEVQAEVRRPYGVSMQARTGKPCTLEDLMAAEAATQGGYGRRRAMPQAPQDMEAGVGQTGIRAQDTVETISFRRVTMDHSISANAGAAPPFRANPDSTKVEAQTRSRSPFHALRSLFSRTGTEKHDDGRQSH
jgi:hypothetical protein